MPVLHCPQGEHGVEVPDIADVLIALHTAGASMVFPCPEHGRVARRICREIGEMALAHGATRMLARHPERMDPALAPIKITPAEITRYLDTLGDDVFAEVRFDRLLVEFIREEAAGA